MTVPATIVVEVPDTTLLIEEERIVLEMATGLVTRATHLRSVPISSTAPLAGQTLLFDGTAWAPGDVATQAGIDAVAADLATHEGRTDNPHSVTKAQVGLGNVENTALSTWAGSAALITLGTVTTGVWDATAIAWAKVDKTGSSLADLATRSAADLSSGVLADARVQASNVTQHQAALSIAETQIPDGALLARIADAETISGLWAFSNAGGLQTDVVAERTAAAGVTVDGLLIKDGSLPNWVGSTAITTLGTIATGSIPAARVTAGTFGAGTFVVPGVLSLTATNVNTNLLVGGSQQLTAGSATIYPQASVYGSGTANSHALSVFRWANATGGAAIFLGHSRTGTIGNFSALQSGDQVARISFVGDDGTDYQTTAARITVLATGAWSTPNRGPSSMEFQVAAGVSDDDIAARMTLTSAALTLEAGVALDLVAALRSTSTGRFGASTISAGSNIEANAAVVAATPVAVVVRVRNTTSSGAWATGAANFWGAYDFYGDDSTSPPGASVRARVAAFYENVGGTLTGLGFFTGPTGGATLALTLGSDLTANFAGAIQRAGTQVVNTRRTGWTTVPTGTLDRTTFVSDSVTLPNLAARVAALIIDLHASAGHGLIGA